jgi:hypothetical protein
MPVISHRYRPASDHSRRQRVAREPAAGYEPVPPSVDSVVAKLRAAHEELAALDLAACTDRELGDLLGELVTTQTRLAAEESRLVPTFTDRQAHREDACVTTASWLRWKTRIGYADAQRRCKRARLLRHMPLMAAAFATAEISTGHVDAVALRAVPQRLERLAEHDATLTELARNAQPLDVRRAVKRIVELVDPDGADDPPPCSNEDLRDFRIRGDRFGGLSDVEASVTPLLAELFHRARDLYSRPDPPDTPGQQRRTPGQIFHDALRDALCVAIDNHPNSAIDGVKCHVVTLVDLNHWLGRDELASITPRLGSSGVIDPETARHLLTTTNTTLRMVLSLGPWMPVALGRARRVIPEWMRGAAQLVHVHCRGPGCDRLVAWCEMDHAEDYAKGGETALFNTTPDCPSHHRLKHDDGWLVTFDVHTGVVTWTSRDGTRRIEVPPDP